MTECCYDGYEIMRFVELISVIRVPKVYYIDFRCIWVFSVVMVMSITGLLGLSGFLRMFNWF